MKAKVLLVERDEVARGILFQHLSKRFPHFKFDTAGSSEEVLLSVQANAYDVVIGCDILAKAPEMLCDMCTGCRPLMIMLTGDTNVTKEAYPTQLTEHCLFEVLHKPLGLREVFRALNHAVERAKLRRDSLRDH